LNKKIEIIGGGLAGLSLAVGLASRNIPVRVREAGSYPRHRVCGEFILGLDQSEIDLLGISPALEGAVLHHDCMWFNGNKRIAERRLPFPAHGTEEGEHEGTVLASGRKMQPGKWIGLKAHYLNLPLHCGLEMHLGNGGYVGLTQVEDNRVNVCALLPAPLISGIPREASLPGHLARIGLTDLSKRLDQAEVDAHSITGVSHFSLGWQPSNSRSGHLVLGDRHSMIPPFTGAGMSMAFQASSRAVLALQAWSQNEADWATARSRIEGRMRRDFSLRMALARLVHPLLLRPGGTALLSLMLRGNLLPFDTFVRKLRGR
jgi:2-polyprenyl-6-methoxyphenol hydroxylase-like FAD-dependent oxidoreductase